MDVVAAHKDANLHALFLDVLLLHRLLDGDNRAVGRRDEAFPILGEHTTRDAEKERHQHPEG